MPLTLVQKRALLAAANNVHKGEKEYMKANREYSAVPSWLHWLLLDAAERKIDVARAKWRKARDLLNRLEGKLGVNGRQVNYHLTSQNVIANVLKKHKLAGPMITRVQEKLWSRGLESEKKRAMANFAKFSRNPLGLSPSPPRQRRKTPSPPRARGPSPRSPATLARQANLGIVGGARRSPGAANNTRVTWRRNANGKINRFKTLANINMKLSQAERNALRNMSENQAMNYIRNRARER
jgi:hypothetical protein